MPYYKDDNDEVYFYDTAEEFEEFAPAGLTSIDESEADALRVIPVTWDYIRGQRNTLIAASDWTQLDDSPLKGSQSWLDYRQALRDITDEFENPADVVWPEVPA